MKSKELREKFLQFFKEKGHTIIPSASLIPENDPTVLFTTAGMHPLVPYLMGESHPGGNRLANAQKCLRTDDIEEVGDNRHLTFFEMLGNWSLGDYLKKEAIEWSFEFLTDKKWLGLDPKRLWVSVFAGDTDAPFDEESFTIWKGLLGSDLRIFKYGKDKNWWGPVGETGPCGPDTEMFYDTGRSHDTTYGATCHPNCDCGRFVEIWNDVFMEYNRTTEGRFEPLKQKNVDTGMGLERTALVLQNKETVFETDLFVPIIKKIEEFSNYKYNVPDEGPTYHGKAIKTRDGEWRQRPFFQKEIDRAYRIIADHIRAVTFILGDDFGVMPSNKDQGYIARRLIRRSVVQGTKLGITSFFLSKLADTVIQNYKDPYTELARNRDKILSELDEEEQKFHETLAIGIKKLDALIARGVSIISGDDAFELYATYGFPLDLTREMVREKTADTVRVDEGGFKKRFEEHQTISRAGSEQKFAGGLADHSAEVIRGHTATHLLHQALRTVLGEQIMQRGSNITRERLRFDFSFPRKLTPEELNRVEALVSEQIQRDLLVHFEVLDMEEAKQRGALGFFDDKYAALGGKIKVYFVGDEQQGFFSKEICGGPHVTRTSEIRSFKIIKEEAVSAGVRRIKAVVG